MLHKSHDVSPVWAWLWPAGQYSHSCCPPSGWYDPAAPSKHAPWPTNWPTKLWYVPGSHVSQLDWRESEYLATGHEVQVTTSPKLYLPASHAV